MFGSALWFDGTSQLDITASESTDDYLNGFTYLLRLKPTSPQPNANTRLIERDWHNPTIQIGPADFYGSIVSGGVVDNSHIRGGLWGINEWSFVALTYDGDELGLYVDDETVNDIKVGKPDLTKLHSDGAICLAAWKQSGWNFIGAIDEAAIFNVALSEDDLGRISEKGLEEALGGAAVSAAGKLTSTWGQIKGF